MAEKRDGKENVSLLFTYNVSKKRIDFISENLCTSLIFLLQVFMCTHV